MNQEIYENLITDLETTYIDRGFLPILLLSHNLSQTAIRKEKKCYPQ